MSGESVAYHLRTNKFVERQLFLDLLDFVRIWNGPSKYFYASMGGRFLEDFKILHERYAIDHMISIEMDKVTSQRQEFNRPLGCIECKNQTSAEFIDGFNDTVAAFGDVKSIVWLDFAAANERRVQLQEFEQLVSKLSSGDVVKITLNANFSSRFQLKDYQNKSDFQELVIGDLNEQLSEYTGEEGVQDTDLKPKEFAELLADAVRKAALRGISNSQCAMQHLASFRYRDGWHQMLTVTALVVDDKLQASATSDEFFLQWPCRSSDWTDVVEIKVPDMSQKERAFINSLVSRRIPQEIHEEMPFKFETADATSLFLLANYIEHYRRYPAFGRVYV